MAKNVGNIAHKKSSMVSTDSEGKVLGPKLPEASALIEGEIAVNYAKGYETLSIKNSSGDIATFSCDATIQNTINSSVDSKINETVGDIGALKSELNSHTGNRDIHLGPEQVAAIDAVSSKANASDLTTHTASTTVHITANERNTWNAVSGKADSSDVYTKTQTYTKGEVDTALGKKLDASAYTATDLSAYSTTEQMNSAISSAVAPKANSADLTAHTADKTIHVTANERSKWNAVSGKADSSDVYTKTEIDNKGYLTEHQSLTAYSTTSQVDAKISAATSGKADSSTVTSLNNSLTGHTTNGTIHITADERSKWNAKAEVSKIPTKVSQLSNDKNFISYAKYDDAAKKINFYADSASTATSVVSIDATAFVKDGMVNSASVSGSNLVITFNTDAGKDNIAIPISSIFNASNYYTTANTYNKTEVDNKLAGKSDTNHTHAISGVTGLQAALDGKSNTGHKHTIAEVTDLQSALDGKSGTGHTHNYAGSSSVGGAANSVAGTLTLQFNSTTNQTYNGSAAKTFNVTPAAIGAAPSSHSHNYAGSSSAGGAANSAVALTTATAGSATQPVYFTGGKPAACSYTLGKSVPADAVFTDTNTTYSAGSGIGLTGTQFYNSGVRAIGTGTANGTISVNTNGSTANVSVYGLGSAAYTNSGDYATASHSHTPASIGALPTAAQQFSAVSTTQSITNATCPFTFTADGQNGTVMYYNSGSANVTITVSTNYKTPTTEQLNITIVPGGYGEVNYLRFNSNMIVARGL